jgi:recombination protein RecT
MTRASPQEKVDAVVARQQNSYRRLSGELQACATQIGKALPQSAQLLADQFIRVLMTAISSNKKLLECTPQSIIKSAFEAAALGLRIDSVLGHAYVVPYKNIAQLQIGYRGFEELAYRSGRVDAINATAVREHDSFAYDLGSDSHVQYTKPMRGERGELIGAFAIAYPVGGGRKTITVLTLDEVLKRRDSSSGYQMAIRYKREDNPWQVWPDEMFAKTAIRALAKRMPLSPELQRVAAADEQRDLGHRVSLVPDQHAEAALAADAVVAGELGAEEPEAEPERQPGQEG